MNERIQKILSARGLTSRRKAEEWIVSGRVTVNGAVVNLGDRADPDVDEILLDGKPLPTGGEFVYIMLHKPRGYVTTMSDEKGRKNVTQLVSDCGQRVYPVGRLDMDSEGLLILTNDGEFANRLMHPRHVVTKIYHVTVNGYCEDALEQLKRPVTLDGYTIQPPEVSLVQIPNKQGNAVIRVGIHEGRNRQVRRMCAMAGLSVRRLVRIAEGSLELGSLPLGQWRYLTEDEIAEL